MSWPNLFDPETCGRLCLALVHSLWQTALLALIAVVVTRLPRRLSVEASYLVHVVVLAACVVVLPATFVILPRGPAPSPATVSAQPAVSADALARPPAVVPAAPRATTEVRAAQTASPAPAAGRFAWRRFAPWLVALYAAGVVAMLVRLGFNVVAVERLRRAAQPIVDGPAAAIVRDLAARWRLRVAPLVARTEQLAVPTVLGLGRPAILLPAAVLSGLAPAELELILAHELAHVRRGDLWVNLLQRLAEVAFFFNPAVWLLSRRIAELREYCCDELACRSPNAFDAADRLDYAAALVHVVELARPRLAVRANLASLAANGDGPSQLRRRVARLLGEPSGLSLRLSHGALLLVNLVALLVICGPVVATRAGSTKNSAAAPADKPSATDPEKPPADPPKPAAEPAKDAAPAAVNRFSFGGHVDVLALGTHDEDPQLWWDAEGNPLESVPFSWSEAGQVTSPDQLWRRVVFRIRELPGDADVQWHITGAGSSAGGKVTYDFMPTPVDLFSRYFGVVGDRKTIDLRVGVANGPWRTVAKISPYGSLAMGGPRDRALVVSRAIPTTGATVVVVSHNYFDEDFRLVAVDKQGKTHDTAGRGGSSASNIYQSSATFSNLSIDEIDRFEFQVRDYEWVVVKDLPLEPKENQAK